MNVGEVDITENPIINLGQFGHLRFALNDGLYYESNHVTRMLEIPNLVNHSYFIHYWYNVNSGIVLLCDSYGLEVIRIDIYAGRARVVAKLNRTCDDDSGVYRTEFIDLPSGCIFVYEGGIIAFNEKAEINWRVDHQYIDRLLVGVREGCAWYESEHEGTWGYRLVDGKKINWHCAPLAPKRGDASHEGVHQARSPN